MAKYRKKPVVIDAVQQSKAGEVYDYLHETFIPYAAGDWIITGVRGEEYPCADEVFQATYEKEADVSPSLAPVCRSLVDSLLAALARLEELERENERLNRENLEWQDLALADQTARGEAEAKLAEAQDENRRALRDTTIACVALLTPAEREAYAETFKDAVAFKLALDVEIEEAKREEWRRAKVRSLTLKLEFEPGEKDSDPCTSLAVVLRRVAQNVDTYGTYSGRVFDPTTGKFNLTYLFTSPQNEAL